MPCTQTTYTHKRAYNTDEDSGIKGKERKERRACVQGMATIVISHREHLNSTIPCVPEKAKHEKPSSRVSSLDHALHATHTHIHPRGVQYKTRTAASKTKRERRDERACKTWSMKTRGFSVTQKYHTYKTHTQREDKLIKGERELANAKAQLHPPSPPSSPHTLFHHQAGHGERSVFNAASARSGPCHLAQGAVPCRVAHFYVGRVSLHAFQSSPPSRSTIIITPTPAPPTTTHSPLTVGAIAPAAAS